MSKTKTGGSPRAIDPNLGGPLRSMFRVKIEFVLCLPPGSAMPSPTMEAVESAALAIAGPVEIAPGSKISVGRVGRGTGSGRAER